MEIINLKCFILSLAKNTRDPPLYQRMVVELKLYSFGR